MATHLVNLDALIIREDFEVKSDAQTAPSSLAVTIKASELEESSLTFKTIRKPDFQRETASWEPKKVMELVKNFLDGDLIPSIILWRAPDSANIFVIDGAHRLSALIAWIHDDYGDNRISRVFYQNLIPPEQERAAKQTRDLIQNEIGSYESVKQALQHPENSPPERRRRAKNLSMFSFQVQWVQGDATKAEASFLTINQKAAPIHPTELEIIQSRKKPNAVAARALLKAGVGHKYWSAFAPEKQAEIERLARTIYNILFVPALETPIKTLDLPIAGRGYSGESVHLIFEFVKFVNRKSVSAEDTDGAETIKYLQKVEHVASRISGDNPRSLGLHPAVYFYSATGRYQPAAFLAVVRLMEEFEDTNSFEAFTHIRKRFEDFLVSYRFFINQTVRRYGAGTRAYEAIYNLFKFVFDAMKNAKPYRDEAIVKQLVAEENFKRYLNVEEGLEKTSSKDFDTRRKSAAFLSAAIETAPCCAICGARIHRKSISFDHKIRKQDGGTGDTENAQLSHPYCNTGYKECAHSRRRLNAPDSKDVGSSPV
ncbi:MAG: HNH endonuclease family protein [Limisphaerales bacterium]